MANRPETPDPKLALRTLAVVRELYDGRWTAYPLAQPEMASHGGHDVNLGELSLFLEEHLQRADPALLSRYSFPAETALHHIDVDLPRADLPRRLAVKVPLRLAVVVVPIGRDRWVLVLPLGYTFHIDAKEDLTEAVRAEVRRVVRARELSPAQWLALLPPAETTLEPLAVDIELEARLAAAGRASNLRKKLAQKKARDAASEVLRSVGRAVHERDEIFAAPALTARDAELAELAALLTGRERRAVALVGDRLAGKTALLHQWLRDERAARDKALRAAHALADGEAREKALADIAPPRQVFATSAAQLVAGMSGLGQWQERLRRVIEAAETLDAVLYFDDLGDLFADREGSYVDIPSAMRRVLDEARLRLVGEITPEQVGLFEPRYVGFFANLMRVHVRPLSREQATRAVERAIAHQRKNERERPTLDPRAVPALVELVDRYVPYHAYPGKATRLLEETRAAYERERDPEGAEVLLEARHVYQTFSQRSGIPLFLLRDDQPLQSDDVRATFERQLIGQREAVARVVETIAVIKANLQPGGRPLAVFLFVGPTGVGKTELAKCLATYLFGSSDRLLRFDMSEYQDPLAAERLIRGTDRAEGVLTRKVRQQPFCVVLLDEIEKAHSAVFDLLLSVFGEGRLTDARGQTAFFHNAIIIMTSNLGAAHRHSTIGVAPERDDGAPAQDKRYYERKVAEAFRPELVGRIDRIIAFHPLSEAEVMRVGELHIARIAQRRGLGDMSITLSCADEAIALLARRGYSAHYGARALRRELEDHLVAPIARLCSEIGAEARGATLEVSLATGDLRKRNETLALAEEHGLRFELRRGVVSSARELRGIADVAALRRQVDRWFELERVEGIKEQIDMCVSQIAQASKRRGRKKRGAQSTARQREDSRTAREIAELQARHHRLSSVYERARAARDEMLQVEELAMTALFEGEETASFTSEVRRAYEAFRRELLMLLTVEEPGRDQIALLLQDLSGEGNRAMPLWLSGLLDQLPARGWSLAAHIADDPRGPQEIYDRKAWPPVDKRRFGPPRPPEVLRERLAQPGGVHACVLLVRGPWAGTLLTTEAGLLRFVGCALEGDAPASRPQHLFITRLGMLSGIPWHDWDGELFKLPKPTDFHLLVKRPAVREIDANKGSVELSFKQATLELAFADYWQNIEQLALEHLLIYETSETLDRDLLFTGALGHDDEDDDEDN